MCVLLHDGFVEGIYLWTLLFEDNFNYYKFLSIFVFIIHNKYVSTNIVNT